MSTRAEDVLFLSLTDTDAMESLARIGLDPEAIPTEEMRQVVAWAIEMFFLSGRTIAPTRVALLETWGELIENTGVELLPEDEDADTVEWAIDTLTARFVDYQHQSFIRAAGGEMLLAPITEKVAVLAKQADALFTLSVRVQPRHLQVEAAEGFRDSLAAYEARQREGHQFRGMTFGLSEVDTHTYGIHPGEVAVLAAGPKVGKSYWLAKVALQGWAAGRRGTLFTLENSTEMSIDRMVCMHLGIDSRDYQRGLCSLQDVERIRQFVHDVVPTMPGRLHIIKPEPGKRTMAAMVRQAQMLGTQDLYLDQLTFIDSTHTGSKPRPEVIGDLMHDLKSLISTGPEPIPCLLAHQINRKGIEGARLRGWLLMEDMAEGSEVERTADWVFGLHRSESDVVVRQALLQVMAARREELCAWQLSWEPARGHVSVMYERELAS